MVYLYRKCIKNKIHFYLRQSKAINKKVVTKDILYLGTDPELLSSKITQYRKTHPEISIPHMVRRTIALQKDNNKNSIDSCCRHWHYKVLFFDSKSKQDAINHAILDMMTSFSELPIKKLRHLIYTKTTPVNLSFEEFNNTLYLFQECEKGFMVQECSDDMDNIFKELILAAKNNYRSNHDIKETILNFNMTLSKNGIPGIIIDSKNKRRIIDALLADDIITINILTTIYIRKYWRTFL